MADVTVRDVEERVEAVRRARPAAYELALVLSPAARVERALLRRARLELTDADASAEADLWASPLVAAQTPQGFVFDREAAALLRERLATDRARFDRACGLIASEHRDSAWPIRAEELIYRLTADADDESIAEAEAVLVATARRMVESSDRRAAGAWVLRTLLRLPPVLDRSPLTRALHAGVRAQVDGTLDLPDDLPPDAADNLLPWLLADAVDTAALAVRFGEGTVEFERADPSITDSIRVPATSPLVIDVQWADGFEVHTQRLSLEPDGPTRLAVPADDIEVRGIDGSRYRLRRPGYARETGGFDYTAIRARHRPFIGREAELDEIDAALRERQKLGIVGPDGLGKTALLCGYLDLLESRGEEVLVHFIEGGPESWGDAGTIEAALRAQLRALGYEFQGDFSHRAFMHQLETSLGERRLFILLDAITTRQLDELIVPWLESRLPHQVRLVYTSESPIGMLPDAAIVDLEVRDESNADLCRRYVDACRGMLESRGVSGHAGRRKVFLSYSSQDSDLAERIARAIRTAGLDVTTALDMSAAQEWQAAITRMIEEADVCVVLATRAAAASESVAREIEQMLSLGKEIRPIAPAGPSMMGIGSLRRIAHLHAMQLPEDVNLDDLRRALVPAARATDVLLEKAEGQIGRLVRMIEWIARQDVEVKVERIPPTLYDGFDAAWNRLMHTYDVPVGEVIGMLAAAQVPLPLTWLSISLSTPHEQVVTAVERLAAEGLVRTSAAPQTLEDDRGNVTGVFSNTHAELADASLRTPVIWGLPADAVRSYHARLAVYPDEAYRLTYRLRHLVDAGQAETARREALDMDLLARICATCGVDVLEEQLDYIVQRGDTRVPSTAAV